MAIKFEKWQGLGNDFIVLFDDIATSDLAIKMCDRNFGVGADGLFCPTKSDTADISWKFFNSDGTVAQMCGNGIRCFAKFLRKHGIVDKDKFSVETLKGIVTPEILENGNVLVDMGEPVFEPELIPVNVDDTRIRCISCFNGKSALCNLLRRRCSNSGESIRKID